MDGTILSHCLSHCLVSLSLSFLSLSVCLFLSVSLPSLVPPPPHLSSLTLRIGRRTSGIPFLKVFIGSHVPPHLAEEEEGEEEGEEDCQEDYT